MPSNTLKNAEVGNITLHKSYGNIGGDHLFRIWNIKTLPVVPDEATVLAVLDHVAIMKNAQYENISQVSEVSISWGFATLINLTLSKSFDAWIKQWRFW